MSTTPQGVVGGTRNSSTHGTQFHGASCPSCRADQLAGDTTKEPTR